MKPISFALCAFGSWVAALGLLLFLAGEVGAAAEPAKKKAATKSTFQLEVDVREAPELKSWAEDVFRTAARWYPRIAEELRSDGFTPPQKVRIVFSKNFQGIAAAQGAQVIASARYFNDHRDDVGAIVHELVHVVQQYRPGRAPQWLIEGIADYIRFWKYEPQKKPKNLDFRTVKYSDSYRTSASFLAFVTEKYDKELIRKLNADIREGRYQNQLFEKYTGKNLQQLENDWKESLRPVKD